MAIIAALVGGFILAATALGLGQVDVRGIPLEGTLETIFLAGLATVVAGAAAAALALERGRSWGVWALAAVWPAFALLCLVLDRISPAPGPGRPAAFYLLAIGLLPAAATLLLGRWGREEPPAPRRVARR